MTVRFWPDLGRLRKTALSDLGRSAHHISCDNAKIADGIERQLSPHCGPSHPNHTPHFTLAGLSLLLMLLSVQRLLRNSWSSPVQLFCVHPYQTTSSNEQLAPRLSLRNLQLLKLQFTNFEPEKAVPLKTQLLKSTCTNIARLNSPQYHSQFSILHDTNTESTSPPSVLIPVNSL